MCSYFICIIDKTTYQLRNVEFFLYLSWWVLISFVKCMEDKSIFWQTPWQFKIGGIVMLWLVATNWYTNASRKHHVVNFFLFGSCFVHGGHSLDKRDIYHSLKFIASNHITLTRPIYIYLITVVQLYCIFEECC